MLLAFVIEGSACPGLLLVIDGKDLNPEKLRRLPGVMFCAALGGLGEGLLVWDVFLPVANTLVFVSAQQGPDIATHNN